MKVKITGDHAPRCVFADGLELPLKRIEFERGTATFVFELELDRSRVVSGPYTIYVCGAERIGKFMRSCPDRSDTISVTYRMNIGEFIIAAEAMRKFNGHE